MREGLILKLTCPDKHGLVAQIASHASEFSANLVEFNQFTEQKRGSLLCAARDRYREPRGFD